MKRTIQVDWPNQSQIEIITTNTGFFKPGIKGRIIAGGERTVYLGSPPKAFIVPEFTLELTHKGKTWVHPNACQYGRDFIFANVELDKAAKPAIANWRSQPLPQGACQRG